MLRTKLVVFGTVLALMGIVAGCDNNSSDLEPLDNSEIPDEVIRSFVTSESDSGVTRWELTAPIANKFAMRGQLIMEQPTIKFFDRDGSLQTTLVSDFGQYEETSRNMLAYGNVLVTSHDGDVLETDSLLYVNELDKIVSDSPVKLTRGNSVITGIGLECDHELSSVDIKRNVKATIIDEEGSLSEQL